MKKLSILAILLLIGCYQITTEPEVEPEHISIQRENLEMEQFYVIQYTYEIYGIQIELEPINLDYELEGWNYDSD